MTNIDITDRADKLNTRSITLPNNSYLYNLMSPALLRITAVMAAALLIHACLSAQVAVVSAHKQQLYVPSISGELSRSSYTFSVTATGANLDAGASHTLTPPAGSPLSLTLSETGKGDFLTYGQAFASETALNNAFADGNYTIDAYYRLISQQQQQIDFSISGGFPSEAPEVTNATPYEPLQTTNGAFTFKWNTFTTPGADDRISLAVFEGEYESDFIHEIQAGNVALSDLIELFRDNLGDALLTGLDELRLPATQTSAEVSGLDPEADHIVVLVFSRNATQTGPLIPEKLIGYANETVIFYPRAVPPTFTTEPASTKIRAYADTVLSVETDTAAFLTTFQWYKNGQILNGETDTALNLQEVPPTDDGATYYCKATRMGASTDSALATLTVVDIQTYADWTTFVFDVAQQANPAISGKTANPDGDAYTNWQEYAFDLQPLTFDSLDRRPHAASQGKPDYIGAVNFRQLITVTDIDYDILYARNLDGPWTELADDDTDIDRFEDGYWAETHYETTLDETQPQVYFRVRVEEM